MSRWFSFPPHLALFLALCTSLSPFCGRLALRCPGYGALVMARGVPEAWLPGRAVDALQVGWRGRLSAVWRVPGERDPPTGSRSSELLSGFSLAS